MPDTKSRLKPNRPVVNVPTINARPATTGNNLRPIARAAATTNAKHALDDK